MTTFISLNSKCWNLCVAILKYGTLKIMVTETLIKNGRIFNKECRRNKLTLRISKNIVRRNSGITLTTADRKKLQMQTYIKTKYFFRRSTHIDACYRYLYNKLDHLLFFDRDNIYCVYLCASWQHFLCFFFSLCFWGKTITAKYDLNIEKLLRGQTIFANLLWIILAN